MWVSIRDNCVGCGACAVISPEVFGMHGRKAAKEMEKQGAKDMAPDYTGQGQG